MPEIKSNSKLIAAKNDLMRKTFMGCQVVFTPGVRSMDAAQNSALIEAIQKFDAFTTANDPHEEHDFGRVQIEGVNYFWKFDYYDATYEGFLEDGNRVLTIMRADEY